MSLDVRTSVNLAELSTMRLGGEAAYVCNITDRFDVPKALEWAESKQFPVLMVGGGSNIIWKDEGFNGLVLVNKISGISPIEEDKNNAYLTVGSGEIWDTVVETSVNLGYSDLAPLSLIPGTVGATPIQNVGAYGAEISQSLVSVEAYDRQQKQFVTIPSFECGFAYRSSRFKTTDKNRFFITGITLHLTKHKLEPPFYAALQHYFTEHGIRDYTGKTVRQSVVALRSLKLPNPELVANCGSFFSNPIVDKEKIEDLLAEYPGIKYWALENGSYKIAAGWLVETAGLRGIHDDKTGMATWSHHALVVVNEHAKSTRDLIDFTNRIKSMVHEKFDVELLEEPEILP